MPPLKTLIKKACLLLYPLAPLLQPNTYVPGTTNLRSAKPTASEPFLCVITPVFDGCIESLKGLINDLQHQTHSSFIHVMISNGPSPQTAALITQLHQTDSRFQYVELPEEPTRDGAELLANLGKRRNYGLQNFKAKRYVFGDADSAIMQSNYISQLIISDFIFRKDILMTLSRLGERMLPQLPLNIACMDITNMVISQKIASEGQYPTDVDPVFGSANDWRFFLRINKPNNTSFVPILGFDKDVRKTYENVTENFKRTVSMKN